MHEKEHLEYDLTTPWVLPSGPSSVPLARRAARRQLESCGVTDSAVLDTVELLVSELTANVVKHVGGRASLRVAVGDKKIRIEVCDSSPTRIPVEQHMNVESISGRGLLLVSTLASSWGFQSDDAQKCTWVEVDL
ncbi:MAG TPA: ATP-binding protein [Actinomycetes bacterium]|nr:ATP-binding protein [Actinomycetes bacterium]